MKIMNIECDSLHTQMFGIMKNKKEAKGTTCKRPGLRL